VCEASASTRTSLSWFPFSLTAREPAATNLALAYDARNATPIGVFDDSYSGSALAAAVFLNVLLPAGALAAQANLCSSISIAHDVFCLHQ
jgi:hypothetical protein